jgi:replicative DNA helicase
MSAKQTNKTRPAATNVNGEQRTTGDKHAGDSQPSFLDSASFDNKSYPRGWLINHILVPGQPGVVGGAKKTLKTSLAVDMAVSLGTGKPFLGHFAVPKRTRVAVISGESGEATLQETARRICAAKNVKLDRGCDVLWSFDLPRLNRKDDRRELTRFLKTQQVKVVIIDPLYLSLLTGRQGASASNLYETGPLLRQAAQACLEAGTTPIFIHHTTKVAGKKTDVLDRDDLAFTGVAEFARQWLLVSRRAPYRPGTGEHELLLAVGGSAGQSGAWKVDVQEGTLNDDLGGRQWRVAVRAVRAQAGVPNR